MKDIVNAINTELLYIKSNNEIPLIDMIKPFGYDDLNSYFYDKVKYQIKKENILI